MKKINRIHLDKKTSRFLTNYKNQEEQLYDKVGILVDSFVDGHKLSKKNFLIKIFNAAFKLIPEAEKGSFYEFNNGKFIPILVNGYDMNIIQNLTFGKDEIFIGFECGDVSSINTFEVYIAKRDESKFSKEKIQAFKELGTYSGVSCIYAPILVEGETVGIISLDNFNKTGFSNMSKKILKLYAQSISNFYTQIVYRENETKMNNDIVTALLSTIEVKDVYTEGHGLRVKEYSIALAQELNMPEKTITDIGTASLLHDVGKIGVPSTILNKPDKLSKEEYEIIKKHPDDSKKILEKIGGFSTIAEYAYNHHERYDGKGYPRGLNPEEIPFESHIIQLADSYDAMTSVRSYRNALSSKEAIKIIEQESGKQFHPEVVKAALDLYSRLYE